MAFQCFMEPSKLSLLIILFLLIWNTTANNSNNKRKNLRRKQQENEQDNNSDDDNNSVHEDAQIVKSALHNVTNIVSVLFRHYSKRIPPRYPEPVDVQIGMYIKDFYDIREESMDFTINFYMRMTWNDPRLSFQNIGRTEINLEPLDITERLWIPDIFMRNEKDTNSLTIEEINDSNTLAKINETGDIWYVRELTSNLRCAMNLQNYPMDIQECPVQFESFKYNMDSMRVSWLPRSIEFGGDVQFKSFTLLKIKYENCSLQYTSGTFPCQEVIFVLQRQLGYFIIQVYMPCILTVMLSWLAFWVDMDTGNQVDLALILVLTMTTISTSAQLSLPRVSYIKAIDVWTFSCLFFVCASLIEISIVSVLTNKADKKRELLARKRSAGKNVKSAISTGEGTVTVRNISTEMDSNNASDKTDDPSTQVPDEDSSIWKPEGIHVISRVTFPLAFIVFCVVYWWWYMSHYNIQDTSSQGLQQTP